MNKLYIAGAGAGKTTKLVKTALELSEKKILITTFTNENTKSIENKIKEKVGVIPQNIEIKTWFSFLLKDGIRPYQGEIFKNRINGMIMDQKNATKRNMLNKSNPKKYVSNNKMYSDKIAFCVIQLNKKNNDAVFNRIAKMYDYIFIDEVQDMAGYDFEIIRELLHHNVKIIMLGDLRQHTYATNYEAKNKQYRGKIDKYIKDNCSDLNVEIDTTTLNKTHRNNIAICEFANNIFPKIEPVKSYRSLIDNTCGVFLLKKEYVDEYLKKFNPMQLRYDKRTSVNENYNYMTYGTSKGTEHDRILIYVTNSIWNWIKDPSNPKYVLHDKTKALFYVAVTRARDSVCIVRKDNSDIEYLKDYDINSENLF